MSGNLEADRIALLLQSLEGGGAQWRVLELANGFAKRGRKVELFLIEPEGPLRASLDGRIEIYPADALSHHLRNDPPGVLVSGAAAVHAFAIQSLPLGHPLPLVLRASSHPFRTLPWSMPRQILMERLRRVKRIRNYSSADLIIAVAADVAEALHAALPGKCIEVIPNPVITQSFLSGAAAPLEHSWAADPFVPVIVSIGRLALAKDYPTLLRAFALVRKVRPVRLVLLGSGSSAELQALMELADRLGIASDIWFAGYCDHVAAWLSRANLLVSSSLWEGSPSALIEALAMGCPVIATKSVGLARELLASGDCGSLVPPGRPQLMAEAIAQSLDRTYDQDRLRAAAEPYRGDRADDYLTAIDRCVERFRRGRLQSSNEQFPD